MGSKNISGQKWLMVVSFVLMLNMSLLAIINYVVDPFFIFQSKVFEKKIQMNERFVKVDYLQKNHQKYNAYLFGSSRIGVIEPKVFEQYISKSRFYNFTLSSANFYDYLKHLEYFVKENYEIKTLVLQLDVENMNNYGEDSNDYLSLLHPDVVDESLALFYGRYLFGFFPLNLRSKIEINLQKELRKPYDLERGSWKLPILEKELIENDQQYVAKVKRFHLHNRRVIQYTKRHQDMKALKNIVGLCEKKGVKLYVFTTPHNKNMMDTFVLKDYKKYLNDIVSLTDFYDFSGYNSVTNNNTNYYETSHYRPHVGKLIARKIFNDKELDVPADFGIYRAKGVLID